MRILRTRLYAHSPLIVQSRNRIAPVRIIPRDIAHRIMSNTTSSSSASTPVTFPVSTYSQPSLCSLLSPGEHRPKNPASDVLANEPDSDSESELCTLSQIQPYLRNEPKASAVTTEGINGFFRYVFSRDITADEVNLHISDLKYNPSKPWEAEMLLRDKLNGCIDSLSLSKFITYIFACSYTDTAAH